MADTKCRDCERPIRIVSLATWNGQRIAVDYRPSDGGEYAILGPDTAAYVKAADRPRFAGTLYQDHKRTCPVKAKLFPNMRIVCDECKRECQITDSQTARQTAERFFDDHATCRKKKAS
jgi:hypothetical protein